MASYSTPRTPLTASSLQDKMARMSTISKQKKSRQLAVQQEEQSRASLARGQSTPVQEAPPPATPRVPEPSPAASNDPMAGAMAAMQNASRLLHRQASPAEADAPTLGLQTTPARGYNDDTGYAQRAVEPVSEPEPELERRDDDRHAIKGDGLMLQFGSSLTAREQKSIASQFENKDAMSRAQQNISRHENAAGRPKTFAGAGSGPSQGTSSAAARRQAAALEEEEEEEVDTSQGDVLMISVEKLRNQVEMQRIMKRDIHACMYHVAYLVLVLFCVSAQLRTSTSYMNAHAMQHLVNNAATLRAEDGLAATYQDVRHEQDLYTWLQDAYFASIQGTEWLGASASVKYDMHSSCDMRGKGLVGCQTRSTPTWNSQASAYEAAWEERTRMRKYNTLLGGVKISQRRGEVYECDDHGFFQTAPAPHCYASRDLFDMLLPGQTATHDDVHARGVSAQLKHTHLFCRGTYCDSVDASTASLFPALFSARSINEEAMSRYMQGTCGGSSTQQADFAKRWGRTRQVAAALFFAGRPARGSLIAAENVSAGSIKAMNGTATRNATVWMQEVTAILGAGLASQSELFAELTQSAGWQNSTAAAAAAAHGVRLDCYKSAFDGLKAYVGRAFQANSDDRWYTLNAFVDPWVPGAVIGDFVHHLQRHRWIDEGTREVRIELPAYNSNTNSFTLTTVSFSFDIGGGVSPSSLTSVLRIGQYNSESIPDWIRFVCECLAVLTTLAYLYNEKHELVGWLMAGDCTDDSHGTPRQENKGVVVEMMVPSVKVMHDLLPHERLLKVRWVLTGRTEIIRSMKLNRFQRTVELMAEASEGDDAALMRARALVRAISQVNDPEAPEPEVNAVAAAALPTKTEEQRNEDFIKKKPSEHLQSLIPDDVRMQLEETEKQYALQRAESVALQEQLSGMSRFDMQGSGTPAKKADPAKAAADGAAGGAAATAQSVLSPRTAKKQRCCCLGGRSARGGRKTRISKEERAYKERVEEIRHENETYHAHKENQPLPDKRLLRVQDLLPGDEVALREPRTLREALALYAQDGSNFWDLLTILLVLTCAGLWVLLHLRALAFEVVGRNGAHFDMVADPAPFADMLDEMHFLSRILGAYRALAGLTVLLLFCKTLKYGRQHDRVSVFLTTLWHAGKDLAFFCGVFMSLIVGFAMCAHYTVGSAEYEYSTAFLAITSCFNMLLGKFDPGSSMTTDHAPLVVVFFYLFNIVMGWVLLTAFVAIMSDAYTRAKLTAERAPGPVLTKLALLAAESDLTKFVDWCNYALHIKDHNDRHLESHFIAEKFRETTGSSLPDVLVMRSLVDHQAIKLSKAETQIEHLVTALEADAGAHTLSRVILLSTRHAHNKLDASLKIMQDAADMQTGSLFKQMEDTHRQTSNNEKSIQEMKEKFEQENATTRSAVRSMVMQMHEVVETLKPAVRNA